MPTPMHISYYRTLERGIRVREHLTRTFSGTADLYYTLRFRINGRTKELGLGWASRGWSLLKARAKLQECLLAAKQGKLPDRTAEIETRSVTLFMIWQEYQHTLSKSMQMTCRSFIKCHLGEIMPLQVCELRTALLDALRLRMEQKNLRPQTVKHVLAFIRQLVRWGARRGYCAMPRLDKLYFDMPQFDNTTTEYLTLADIQRLFTGLNGYDDQVLACAMRLALYTGMRRGAIFALRWDDIDSNNRTIRLRAEAAKSGKTSYIAMNDEAHQVFERLAILTENTEGAIFGAKRVTSNKIRAFTEYIKKFLPKGYRPFYCLRHTFASILANAGVNQITLQQAMSHCSVNMVQRYAHLQTETLAEASAAVTRHLAKLTDM